MQVYKTFFKVVRHYKVSLLMYTAIIIFMLLVMTYSSSSGGGEVVQSKYTILVVDEDGSEVSKALVDYLYSKHYHKDGTYSDNQIKDMLYYEHISEYLVIPKGFGDEVESIVEDKKSGKFSSEDASFNTLLQATYDEALPRGIFINMQIDQYLNALTDYMANGESVDSASTKTDKSLDITDFVSIKESEVDTTAGIYSSFLFLPFGLLTIIFSGVMPVITSFNETEKKNRTKISSFKFTSRNIALVLGAATIAFIVATLLIVLSTARNGFEYAFTTPWWLASINTYVYTLSITMMLSMITSLPLGINKKGTANTSSFLTVIIGLAFAFLGGTFVSLEILGDRVAVIGRFIPNYWYSIANRRIWYNGADFSSIIDCLGFELLFGIVCLSIGLAFTRFFGDKADQ